MQTWDGVGGNPEKAEGVFPATPEPTSLPCWLPTLSAFAHSLAMRKPSAEAREKVRFLWTVARSDLGTLDRQGRC